MLIDLEPEQQQVIELAIQSGAFHSSKEVIATALTMLAEDIEDGAVSEVSTEKAGNGSGDLSLYKDWHIDRGRLAVRRQLPLLELPSWAPIERK